MGALCASLEAMFKAITGKELKTVAFGKPQLGTFQLPPVYFNSGGKIVMASTNRQTRSTSSATHPESDIRGTSEFYESGKAESTWYSILVRAGVFQQGIKPAYTSKR